MSTPALELKGELQSLPDDDELGSYIVDGLLNTTGSSCIWRGHHCDTGEAVAIKVILYDLDEADARTAVADLRNEIEVLRGLSHPGIVKVLHASPLPLMLVTPLLSGPSLAEYTGEDWPTILRAILPAVTGLGYLHERYGAVHRDIKPANIVSGTLLDFGLCHVPTFSPLRAFTHITRNPRASAKRHAGTPLYIAPEIILGETPTPAADIYALFATLVKLIEGVPLFPGNSIDEILAHHVDDQPRTLTGAPTELTQLTQRALAKQPLKRPSITEVLDTFRRLIAPASILTLPTRSALRRKAEVSSLLVQTRACIA